MYSSRSGLFEGGRIIKTCSVVLLRFFLLTHLVSRVLKVKTVDNRFEDKIRFYPTNSCKEWREQKNRLISRENLDRYECYFMVCIPEIVEEL